MLFLMDGSQTAFPEEGRGVLKHKSSLCMCVIKK
jgi:hypothetical protein